MQARGGKGEKVEEEGEIFDEVTKEQMRDWDERLETIDMVEEKRR